MTSTRWLLMWILLLAALDVGVRWVQRPSAPAEAVSTVPFDPADVVAVQLRTSDGGLRITRTETGFVVGDQPADADAVNALIARFAGGVVALETVEVGNPTDYGLAGGRELSITFEGAGGDLARLSLGDDAPGGRTFARWPDSDEVVLVRVGGRGRLAVDGGAWRDRTVVALDPAAVTGVSVQGSGGTFTITRGESGWTAPFPLDVPLFEAALAHACSLVAAAPAEADRAVALTTSIVLDASPPVTLSLGRAGPVSFVRRDGDGGVWRLADEGLWALADAERLRDRTLWTLPAAAVEAVLVERDGVVGRLVRSDGVLRVVLPVGLDVDPAAAEAVVAFLAAPRVSAWVRDAPSPLAWRRRWRVRGGGTEHVLEVASAEGRVFVRVMGSSAVGALDPRVVGAVEGLFGIAATAIE